MRIGHFTECYKPTINGVTHSVCLHKEVLEAWGHEVYVFTLGHRDYQEDEPNVIRTSGVPVSDNGYSLNFHYSRLTQQLAETMDILHAHQPLLAGPQAARVARRANIPLVFTDHTRYSLVARHTFPFLREELLESLLRLLFPRFTAHCDLVVTPSQDVLRWLEGLGVEAPAVVIPNGVDVDRFCRPIAPMTKADLGIPEWAGVAISVGRLSPEKNLDFLLDAFGRAVEESQDLHLVVVGDGPKRGALEEISQRAGLDDRIHWVGAVPYREVPNWLALADFFVIASTAESHPLAVLEATAAGLPVLGIPSSGIRESIQDRDNGLLCPEDVDAFAHRMVCLATDADLRARLAEGARRSRRRFDIRRTSAQLLAQYERLVEERCGENSGQSY
jgi:glycosyltransferase involved in cell wall biosynthesis